MHRPGDRDLEKIRCSFMPGTAFENSDDQWKDNLVSANTSRSGIAVHSIDLKWRDRRESWEHTWHLAYLLPQLFVPAMTQVAC